MGTVCAPCIRQMSINKHNKEDSNMRTILTIAIAGGLLALILTFMSGCCSTSKCAAGHTAAPEAHEQAEISTATLEELIESRVPVTILDARTGKYDDGRRIPGAKGLGADSSEERIRTMLRSEDALIVTYCSNLQCPASRMLAKRLTELGYKNILEYPHGIEGWAAAGNEVEKEIN